MLTLPDSDLAMITPETSREDIRELNRFNKSVPESELDSNIEQLIGDFYISQELVRKAVAVKDNVKALSVGGVAPSEETVKDGSYAIQRPFVLVTKDGVKLSDAAQAFFDYVTSDKVADIITGAGVVPAK